MSWVVEQSENTSAVNVQGDTITCTSDSGYGSSINVLYKDPAKENGEYFWQIEFQNLDCQNGGSPSIGLTTDEGFQAGWGLKAMSYLGNLSSGSALLVPNFGESIAQNDKLGLLLQLNDADLKFYIFHNDKPLGLAFHIQSPYPKPLYPCKCVMRNSTDSLFISLVIGFSCNGTAKISRSKQIPTSLNRTAAQFKGIEGHWKIIKNDQHPETVGGEFEITKENENTHGLQTRVCNRLFCTFEHDPSNNEVKMFPVMSTMMGGPPEEMKKERTVNELISAIQNLTTQGEQQLLVQTNDDQQIQFERFQPPPPSPVTENIFN